MHLDATERWTEHRLVALARALALPCPVRESFLFDPDHAFRQQCVESDTTLQRAVKRVLDHAGLRCDAVVVLWMDRASAKVEADGDTWFFELPARWKANAPVLAGIAARAAGTALLARRNLTSGVLAIADSELAAVLAGLGGVLLADPEPGALHPRLVRYAYARTCAALGVGPRRTLDVVPAKPPVLATWLRVRRRPLPFQPVEPHVIIRCFCAQRLRVPTGAIGATTCPACKRKRPFDGRACRIVSIATPRRLPAAQRPTLAAWERPLVWFAELALAPRLVVIAIVLAVATTFVARY